MRPSVGLFCFYRTEKKLNPIGVQFFATTIILSIFFCEIVFLHIQFTLRDIAINKQTHTRVQFPLTVNVLNIKCLWQCILGYCAPYNPTLQPLSRMDTNGLDVKAIAQLHDLIHVVCKNIKTIKIYNAEDSYSHYDTIGYRGIIPLDIAASSIADRLYVADKSTERVWKLEEDDLEYTISTWLTNVKAYSLSVTGNGYLVVNGYCRQLSVNY